MSSSLPHQESENTESQETMPQQLGGFPLAELIKAAPPSGPASPVSIPKPEHLDQRAIDRIMSPEEEQPISPFITPPGRS